MASETTTGSNIDIVREYTERVFNQHSPDLAAKYLAPGVTGHGRTLGTIKGADSVTGMLRGFIGALPDLRAAEQDIVAAGDTVAVLRHRGDTGGESPGARPYRSPGALGRRRRRDGDLVSSRRVRAAVARGFKANRRGRGRVIRIAVAGRAKPAAVSLQPARHRSASPTSPPRVLRRK